MAMVKKCTNCGMINQANDLECEECGKDLTKIPAVDEEKLKEEEKTKEETGEKKDDIAGKNSEDRGIKTGGSVSEEEQEKSYRVCDCGHENPTTLRKCEKCGESLSGIPITIRKIKPIIEERGTAPGTVINANLEQAWIRTLDGSFSLPLCCGSIVLGRESVGKEYFSQKPYVGRRQAQITFEDGEIFIEDMGSTNGTYINGVRIFQGNRVRVKETDVIGLGGNHVSQTQAAFMTAAKDIQ